MQDDVPKSVKKKLRELVYQAHEAALREPLSKLAPQFERWQRGEIDAIQLADLIHEFDGGPSRKIYSKFTYRNAWDTQMLVAHGIDTGLLDRSAVPEEVLPYLERWLGFYRSTS
ncbi:MAG: hypothetical protein LAQ69_27340 [Acidobacteriia bacterium]|nr:hypothetical protein [Terriglobia bacterium]